MLLNAFATQRYLRFLRGLADRQTGREEAGPWEQSCWQAGDPRSMGGRDRGCEQHGPPPCGRRFWPKCQTQGDLPLTWTERTSMCREVKLGVPSAPAQWPSGKETPTHVKDTSLLLPLVLGAGEVGVGAGAGASSEVFCQHRGAPGLRAAQDSLGESFPARVPEWGRLRGEGAKEQEVRAGGVWRQMKGMESMKFRDSLWAPSLQSWGHPIHSHPAPGTVLLFSPQIFFLPLFLLYYSLPLWGGSGVTYQWG